ncbi:hypothetical protein HELRODRAFT_180410 [Helobdella robusta]|uniref:Uncharacterized protein n=1 Tax=Helobdella robusta TaxID=6412 RepID=T1FFW3_HELRO|nr:hypothetical protein HELRODRAFT_180410 [Helobdella robusta]ESN93990.1 hypothetical protein HELRODRAFT_180410 [Helobdella robusta]
MSTHSKLSLAESTMDLYQWMEEAGRPPAPRFKVTSLIKHRKTLKSFPPLCAKPAPPKPEAPVDEKVEVENLMPTDFDVLLKYITRSMLKDRPTSIVNYIADLLDDCIDKRKLVKMQRLTEMADFKN